MAKGLSVVPQGADEDEDRLRRLMGPHGAALPAREPEVEPRRSCAGPRAPRRRLPRPCRPSPSSASS